MLSERGTCMHAHEIDASPYPMAAHPGDTGLQELAWSRRERTNLRVQLQDTRATVGTLRIIMAVLLQAVNCFFWLAIYNVRSRLLTRLTRASPCRVTKPKCDCDLHSVEA